MIATPRAQVRAIISEVSADYGIASALIREPCRRVAVFLARAEVARQLHARLGFSAAKIGRLLNHDHCTILFYLGRCNGKKLAWRKPHVRPLGGKRCRARYGDIRWQ